MPRAPILPIFSAFSVGRVIIILSVVKCGNMGWLWDLTHDKQGGLDTLNVILLSLAGLHVVAFGVWIFHVLTQKPTRIRDKVDLRDKGD